MIAYVNGILEYVEDNICVIDVSGFGVNVNISPLTSNNLPGVGEVVKLYTYTAVREDAFQLFGFLSRNELSLFKNLITVNGVGPKAGLSLLSTFDADSLKFAISTKDAKTISKAPGIGAKTAERIVLELAGKYVGVSGGLTDTSLVDSNETEDDIRKEAVLALCSLGYGKAESIKAVNQVELDGAVDSGEILKLALKKLF